MVRSAAFAGILFALVGCTASAPELRATDVVAKPLPTPRMAVSTAPPEILGMHLSAVTMKSGDTWSGKIVTTSNVASMEVRSPFFTFSAPKVDAGVFAFHVNVLLVMPIYRRPYTVAFIARNTAGVEDRRDVAIDFR